jgi:uncharacterized protein involved in tellurium resistance
MNSKDYRNIREAYLNVYNDDLREEQEFKSWVTELLDEGYDLSDYTWDEMYDIYNKESYDLYDIILSHLIDEGYADTEQTAEAIMVNMSEEWKEIIVVEDIESRREMLKQQRIQQRTSSTEAQKRKRFKDQDRESLKKEIIRALIQRQQTSTN